MNPKIKSMLEKIDSFIPKNAPIRSFTPKVKEFESYEEFVNWQETVPLYKGIQMDNFMKHVDFYADRILDFLL